VDTILDTRFAAAYLGYSPATLRLWRRKGSGPTFRYVGRFVEYRKEDLDAWSGARDAAAVHREERHAKLMSASRKNATRASAKLKQRELQEDLLAAL
jgi:hypothetical protein